jgi:hypothetical protein
MKKILFVLLALATLTSCEQYITRQYGGNTTIKLEKGEKLIEATWKGDGDLWYLVEPMDSDYTPKTKVFKESSLFGVMEGSVTFIESK